MQKEKTSIKESELLVSGSHEEFFYCQTEEAEAGGISVQKNDFGGVYLRAFDDCEGCSDVELQIPAEDIPRLCQALMLISGLATIARGE